MKSEFTMFLTMVAHGLAVVPNPETGEWMVGRLEGHSSYVIVEGGVAELRFKDYAVGASPNSALERWMSLYGSRI